MSKPIIIALLFIITILFLSRFASSRMERYPMGMMNMGMMVNNNYYSNNKIKNEPTVLLREKGCFMCHGINRVKMGPSFKMISNRYNHNLKAIPILLKNILYGNKNLWYTPMRSMPPQNYHLTKEEATSLAKFILSIK